MQRTEYFSYSISHFGFLLLPFHFKCTDINFFLSPDDSAEFNLVNNALLSIFKMDAKGKEHIFIYMAFINTFQSVVV